MALPVLETPTYTLKLPSTDQEVKFRPFLVKEHKILMSLANSSHDEVSRVIKELIDACTFNSLKLEDLPSFDIEYLFVILRSKSIGEIIPVTVPCSKCNDELKAEIDLNKVRVEKGKNINPKINLRDNIGVILKYPMFEEIMKAADGNDKTKIFGLVASCIKEIFTENEVFNKFTLKEAEDFLLQFTKEEFSKVEEFFENIPKVFQDVEAECKKCNYVNKTTIQGLQNFFV